MNNKWLFLIAFPVLFLACSSSKKVTEEAETRTGGTYLDSAVIDGKAEEWQTITQDYNPQGTFQYAIANNKTNLYVFLRIPSLIEQTKLLRGGMQLWINPAGQKDKKTGVYYPVRGELSETENPMFAPSETRQNQDYHQRQLRMASQLISLNRIGFKSQYTGVQSIRHNTGFKAAINWDTNENLVYELTIPFSALPDGLKQDKIELGFFIQGLDRPKQSEEASHSNGGGDEGNERGGARMGGGHRGGGNFNSGNFGGSRAANQRAINSAYNQKQKVYIDESFWTVYSISE